MRGQLMKEGLQQKRDTKANGGGMPSSIICPVATF